MGVSFQPTQINPQVVQQQDERGSLFLQALLGGANLAQQQQAFELEKKKLDITLTEKKTLQDQMRAEGDAIKQLLPSLIQMGGAAGLMQPSQQGGSAPQGAAPGGMPSVGLTPMAPASKPGPMAQFNDIVGSMPPEMVAGFIQKYKPMVEQAQSKIDAEKSFADVERLTQGLLNPDQQSGLKAARVLFQAGAPKEMWEGLLPKGQVELAKALEEVKNTKNTRDAARLATGQLVKLGLLPPSQGAPGTDYVVMDAPKILTDYIAGVRKDARAQGIARDKEIRDQAVKGLEGTALEIAALNPDWRAPQIKQALKSNPSYTGLPDGVIAQAALQAPEAARRLNAPRNESEARARVTYGPGRAALLTVNAMDAKGESLGSLARLAQTQDRDAATALGAVGAAGGAALGAFGGPAAPVSVPVGTVIGGGIGGGIGLVGAPLVRGAARKLMSNDQQRLWTAAQTLAAAILRPETGAAATSEEIRTTIERYIPLSTDQPKTRELKRVLRQQLDETMANVSGYPPELRQSILDSVLSQHEQALIGIGAASTPPGKASTF